MAVKGNETMSTSTTETETTPNIVERFKASELLGMNEGRQTCSITVRTQDGDREALIWNKLDIHSCTWLGTENGKSVDSVLPKNQWNTVLNHFKALKS